MLTRIDNSTKMGNDYIKIMYPGKAVGDIYTSFVTLGMIDQTMLSPGAIVPMYPYK